MGALLSQHWSLSFTVQVEPVLGCVLSNVIELSMNQFGTEASDLGGALSRGCAGNYVIQHLLQNGNERIFDAISRQLKGQARAHADCTCCPLVHIFMSVCLFRYWLFVSVCLVRYWL